MTHFVDLYVGSLEYPDRITVLIVLLSKYSMRLYDFTKSSWKDLIHLQGISLCQDNWRARKLERSGLPDTQENRKGQETIS